MTKERPILFSGAMVSAILAGTKSQTRRVVKLPHNNPLGEWEATTVGGGSATFADGTPAPEMTAIWHTRTGDTLTCRHGNPGDRLWVRETWGYNPDFPGIPSRACYRADPGHEYDGIKWKPSIHMPRSACRIELEVTGVRVERLNECSEADAMAEGATPSIVGHDLEHLKYRAGYQTLWDQINGAGAWEANPWVWVVEFRRVGA